MRWMGWEALEIFRFLPPHPGLLPEGEGEFGGTFEIFRDFGLNPTWGGA
jgi:hypothetical protein